MHVFLFYSYMRIPPFFLFYSIVFCVTAHLPARADFISLNGGKVIQGTIVQTNDDELLVLAVYGTVKCQTTEIQSIKREPNRKPITHSTNTVAVEVSSTQRSAQID
jgi:hypothetical protein